MKRGDVVLVVLAGDFGKARPAVVVTADRFDIRTVTVCPMTTHTLELPVLRVPITPSARSGIERPSEIMVDKITSLRREKVRRTLGALEPEELQSLNRSLVAYLDLAR